MFFCNLRPWHESSETLQYLPMDLVLTYTREKKRKAKRKRKRRKRRER